jgi:hypothetical protein
MISRHPPFSNLRPSEQKPVEKRLKRDQSRCRDVSRFLTDSSIPEKAHCCVRIRIDANVHCIDFDLAKSVVLCYLGSSFSGYTDFICILLYFLAPEDPALSIKMIDVIMPKSQSLTFCSLVIARMGDGCLSLTDFNCINSFFEQNRQDIAQIPNDMICQLRRHLTRISNLNKEIFSDLPLAEIPVLSKATAVHEHDKMAAFRQWKWAWSHLTIGSSPWAPRFAPIAYVRDFHGAVLFCPIRTKPAHTIHCPFEYPSHIVKTPGGQKTCQKVTSVKTKVKIWRIAKPKPSAKKGRHEALVLGGKSYRLSHVRHLFLKHFEDRDTATELIFCDGYSLLIDFVTARSPALADALESQHKSTIIQTGTAADFVQTLGHTQTWVQGKMSNFAYLMWLNMIAGRTFHDLSQYPVLPSVLIHFSGAKFDPRSPIFFRDLSVSVPHNFNPFELSALLFRIDPFARLYDGTIEGLKSIPEALSVLSVVPPEFYCMPECLLSETAGDVELPEWTKAAFDFVYLHRKALENVIISTSLNVWLDNVFGYRQTANPLFSSPHPRKEISISASILKSQQMLKLPSDKYVFGSIEPIPNERDKFEILAVDSILGIDRISLSFTSDEISTKVHPKHHPNFPSDSRGFFKLNDTTFVALYNHELESIIVSHRGSIEVSKLPSDRRPISVISGIGTSLFLSFLDGTVDHWRVHNEQIRLYSFPTHKSHILCSCASRQFQIVVTGADDRSLVVTRLWDGQAIRSIQLDCIPMKVHVTPGWGFILVNGCEYDDENCFYSLILLNINGLFIRKVQFASLVKDWISWTSPTGFDFILLSAEKGRLFIFEAFFLEVGSPAHRFSSEIVSLHFSSDASVILALESDGTLHLIPFVTASIEKFG